MSAIAWKNSSSGHVARRASGDIPTRKPSGSPISRPNSTPYQSRVRESDR
jgi:hypothetical protein